MKKKNFGFTMVELLIVIVILGILSAIGLRSFIASQEKSRDSNRKSSLNGIVTAMEVYYNDHGGYPLDDTGGAGGGLGKIMGCGVGGVEVCEYGSIWQDDKGTAYMVQIPVDPTLNSYFYISDGVSYHLYARLENVYDRDVPDFNGAPGVYAAAETDCGGLGCNYVVSSTNVAPGLVVAD